MKYTVSWSSCYTQTERECSKHTIKASYFNIGWKRNRFFTTYHYRAVPILLSPPETSRFAKIIGFLQLIGDYRRDLVELLCKCLKNNGCFPLYSINRLVSGFSFSCEVKLHGDRYICFLSIIKLILKKT